MFHSQVSTLSLHDMNAWDANFATSDFTCPMCNAAFGGRDAIAMTFMTTMVTLTIVTLLFLL